MNRYLHILTDHHILNGIPTESITHSDEEVEHELFLKRLYSVFGLTCLDYPFEEDSI